VVAATMMSTAQTRFMPWPSCQLHGRSRITVETTGSAVVTRSG
jgi:hypothetical protein